VLRRLRAWRRKRAGLAGVSLERQTPRPTEGQREASRALYQTECARAEVEQLGAEVTERAARLRELTARNHFAESIRLSLEGGR